MNCPTLLVQSHYADGELDSKQALVFEAHRSHCDACKTRQHHFMMETEALKTALRTDVEVLTVPQLHTAPSARYAFLTIALVITGAVLIDIAWQKLGVALSFPGWLNWLVPGVVDTAFNALDFFAGLLQAALGNGGRSLQTTLLWLTPVILLFAFVHRHARHNASMPALLLCIVVSVAYAPESSALDIRHDDDRITVSANEVIDDTLIVAANEVVVEGDVSGDLIAVGEKVTIRSKIGGNVFAFAEELEIESAINGTVFALGESVEINDTSISGNLFLAGEKFRNDSPVIISGNVLLAAKDAELGADIGRELWAATSSLVFSGTIAKDLRYYGGELELSGQAKIGGHLRAMVADEASVKVHDTAQILGERTVELVPEETSKHSTFDYYFERLMKLLAAFLFGLLLYWLLPSLRFMSALDGRDLLGASALGAIALITTPLLAVLVMFTLIGLPIGIAALLLWIIALYAAPVVAGAYLGDAILGNNEHHKPVLALLLGLLILFVLASIPFVGSAVRLIALIMGLGIIVRWLREFWDAQNYREA